jgi:hypothetical protein
MSELKRFVAVIAFAVFAAAPAFAATSAAGPPDPMIECEFYLTKEANVPGVLRWLKAALRPLTQPDSAFQGYSPRAEAFAALGLPSPYPAHTAMKVEVPVSDSDPYWIRIYSEAGDELARFPFHVPPVVIWKQVKESEIEGETQLAFDIGKEDPRSVSVGLLIGEIPGGRKFISVRRRLPNMVTVAVGIDVDLRDHKKFTEAATPHFVGTASEEVLSRIEVIKAHFRIPVFAPPRRH